MSGAASQLAKSCPGRPSTRHLPPQATPWANKRNSRECALTFCAWTQPVVADPSRTNPRHDSLGLGAACSCALIANDNPRRTTQAHVLRLHTAFCCVQPLAIASMPGRFVPGNTHLFHLTAALPQIASVLTAMGFAQLCTQCVRQAKPRKHRQAARNSGGRHCAGAEHPLQTSATAQCERRSRF